MRRPTPSHALALAAALLSAAASGHAAPGAKTKSVAKGVAKSNVQNVVIAVDGSGYHPSVVSVKVGKPVRMVFVSKGTGCANSVVIPSMNKKFRLRKGQQQAIAWTPGKGQSLAFACSMDMFRGKAVAK